MSFDLSFWKNASMKRKRVYSIILVFIVAVLALVVGSQIQLSSDQAQVISDRLNQTLTQNRENNTLLPYIFLNNFGICLLMFIPLVGAGLGLLILFQTGVALSAIASTADYSVGVALASLVANPVFWLEFAAYSVAMASSVWLFRRFFQLTKPGGRQIMLRELKWTGLSIALCALLLAVGAVVEFLVISA